MFLPEIFVLVASSVVVIKGPVFAMVPTPVRGFKSLRLPTASGSPVTRYLLVKSSDDRTLFVTHLDSFVTGAQLSKCFGAFGPVEKVDLKSTERRKRKREQTVSNFAHVTFKDAASLERALGAASGRIAKAVLPGPVSELRSQVQLFKNLYREPSALRKEVDEWMLSYDQKEAERLKLERENLVDEDGFTKVVKEVTRTDGMIIRKAAKPSRKRTVFNESIGVDPEDAGERKKKKAPREMADFYRVQVREKKRQEVLSVRKQKAADEEKIARMKRARKF